MHAHHPPGSVSPVPAKKRRADQHRTQEDEECDGADIFAGGQQFAVVVLPRPPADVMIVS
ncbi:MAG TPA: hypothetical protein VFR23_23875 [Jiangellaceae bacterium]|nr:hypothetical protein [Jiangellaceae bacterium]